MLTWSVGSNSVVGQYPMKESLIHRIKSLKEQFRSLEAKDRESLSVCFLKAKLGVHNQNELKAVRKFLGSFRMQMSEDNLDRMINYLHSESHTLPEFIAMEESMTDIEVDLMVDTENDIGSDLPDYNADDVDTLTETIKPFK